MDSVTQKTVLLTFDVAFVSDCLQRRPAGQELLQLVTRLLVVAAVHAGGRLDGCWGREAKQDHGYSRTSPGVSDDGGNQNSSLTSQAARLGADGNFGLSLSKYN